MISHETFNLFCWIWIGIGVITFPILLKVTQPYGKHTKKTWGPMLSNKLGWFLSSTRRKVKRNEKAIEELVSNSSFIGQII